ncbi:EF-hand domain-containing protein [Sphingomonas sp. 37zxx]|uniref:EF-hand domain-containing protein n=1 Tax=Sphingomonas sp. 37zxx TaxID=1550073 RepID=UPI00053BDB55|nr:EF-hand domain-containing protein [Sphingomonas sp. 37zxx]
MIGTKLTFVTLAALAGMASATAMAQGVSPEVVAQRSFSRADTNQDGKLDLAEVTAMVAAWNAPPPATGPAPSAEQRAQGWINRNDADKNGSIDLAEMITTMRARAAKAKGN